MVIYTQPNAGLGLVFWDVTPGFQAILKNGSPKLNPKKDEPMLKAFIAAAVVLFLGLVAYLVYLMSGANRR